MFIFTPVHGTPLMAPLVTLRFRKKINLLLYLDDGNTKMQGPLQPDNFFQKVSFRRHY